MSTMALSQVVTKTYGRRSRQADTSHAARAFDEVFSRPLTRTSSTVEKWGKASFTRVSEDHAQEGKRKFSHSDDSSDPFSFDSDDDKSPKKRKTDESKQKNAVVSKKETENLRRGKQLEQKVCKNLSVDVLRQPTRMSPCTRMKVQKEDAVALPTTSKTILQEKDKKTCYNTLVKNGIGTMDKKTVKNMPTSSTVDVDLEMTCAGDGVIRKTKDLPTKKVRNAAAVVNSRDKVSVDASEANRHSKTASCKKPSESTSEPCLSANKDTKKFQVFVENFSQLIASQCGKVDKTIVSSEMKSVDPRSQTTVNKKLTASSLDKITDATDDRVGSLSPSMPVLEPSSQSTPFSDRCLRPPSCDDSNSDFEVHLLSPFSPSPSTPTRTSGRLRQSTAADIALLSTASSCVDKNAGRSSRTTDLTVKCSLASVSVTNAVKPSLSKLSVEHDSQSQNSSGTRTHSGTPVSSHLPSAGSHSTTTRKLLSSSRKLAAAQTGVFQAHLNNFGPMLGHGWSSSSLKTKAIYNPRQWNDSDELSSEGVSQPPSVSRIKPSASSGSATDVFDDLDSDWLTPLVSDTTGRAQYGSGHTGSATSSVGSQSSAKIKVHREEKLLYTVVHNVKEAHECQEYGETQEFCDDIDYIMDGLGDSQATATRCLSAISLASKCSTSAFRMHIRAHDTFTKIFAALHNSPDDPSLALCTSAVMYMMSRDHLAMHIDKSSLQLMLRLLSIDSALESIRHDAEFDKIRHRIHDICSAINYHGNRQRSLTLDNITPGHLAMETLLSLTSKQAGDWFKDSLRGLGGLEQIINTVCRCIEVLDCANVSSVSLMSEQLQRVERCVRVLESVSYMNSENQAYLLSHNGSSLITALHRLLQLCVRCLPLTVIKDIGDAMEDDVDDKDSLKNILSSCLLNSLRLLLNVTHDNESASRTVGKVEGLLSTVLTSALQLAQHVAASQRFDLVVLGIGLLTNLIENCAEVRREFLAIKSCRPVEQQFICDNESVDSLESLGMLFSVHYEAAKLIEEEHDAELEEVEKRQRTTTDKTLDAVRTNASVGSKLKQQKGEWHESDSGIFWQPAADSSTLDSSADNLAAMQACRQEAAMLAGHNSQPACSQDDDENYTKVLNTAGKHMEDSIMAAYIALLIGTLIQHNTNLAEDVRDTLPDFSFSPMVQMLSKFLGFMNLTQASGTNASKSIQQVIEVLEAC